jgi:regulator of cell morphogenesis and NO signaling
MATATQSLREIVASQASAALVLQRFEIDLCSCANQSLTQACSNLQLSVEQVLEKLAAADAEQNGAPPVDPASMSLEKLVQYIVRRHHRVVRQELPRLAALAHKLATKHGERAPELIAIDRLMDDLKGEMIAHLESEESVLFPYVVHLDQDLGEARPATSSGFRRVSQPVRMMMNEHESALRIVAKLHGLTNEFTAPAWACATHVSFHTGLRAFEKDLKQHIHLEDDVLFPRAVDMEDSIGARLQG